MDILKQGKNKSILYLITVLLTYLIVILGFVLYNQLPASAADTTPPTFVKAEASSKQMVYLTFSEPVKQNVGSISIAGNGNPNLTITSVTYASDARILRLTVSTQVYGNKYPTPSYYTVTVTDIQDLAGNTISPNPSTQNFDAFTPHGKYSPYPVTSGNSNRQCGQCHLTHSATGYDLLNRTTIKKVCFVCHGNAGPSDYKVEKEFTSWVEGGGYSTSMHKSLDADSPGYNELSCTNCHNPHGDRRSTVPNEVYAKLLKVTINGVSYYKGNNICFYCHGDTDRGFESGVYYTVYGGNHMNPLDPSNYTPGAGLTTGPVHYDNSTFGTPLNPASNTEITCVKCHERHGSTYTGLLDHNRSNSEEELCFKCHGSGSAYKDIYTAMFGAGKVSRHRVTDTVYGKIECSSCHGPHTVDDLPFASSNGTTLSKISNPDNTKQAYTTANGDITDFCLKCHDGTGPSKTVDATTVVPYSIVFQDPWTDPSDGLSKTFTTNGGKWNKAGPTLSYKDSRHYTTASPIQCTGCHDWHGTNYPWLVTRPEDVTDNTSGICFKCHAGSGGGDNINDQLKLTYNHPTLSKSGLHKNTENYYRDAQSTSAKRHAECYDCHDLHTVKNSTTTQMDKLGNVSGVKASTWSTNGTGSSTTAWDNYPTNTTLQHVYLDPNTNNAQAYLCFKCHSKYAYDPTGTRNGETNVRAPFTTPSDNTLYQTDVAREFNPNVKAQHVVISRSHNNIPAGYGNFVGDTTDTGTGGAPNRNFSATAGATVLKCTDCHSPPTGAQGPHGSSNKFMLIAPWYPTDPDGGGALRQTGDRKNGGTATRNHLCFKCHDWDFYTDPTNQAGQPSSFRDAGNDNWHQGKTDHTAGCADCHGGLPHGWKYTNTGGTNPVGSHGIPLWGSGQPAPYGTGSVIGNQPTKGLPWEEHQSNGSCSGLSGC